MTDGTRIATDDARLRADDIRIPTQTMPTTAPDTATALAPFASHLALRWQATSPDVRFQSIAGTLVFADISGFTRLTERLSAIGKYGAEEMSDYLDEVLSQLLGAAASYGGWLVKWGGDALLLMFEGDDHAARACAASVSMRACIADAGRIDTSVGHVRLRMSVGAHTGSFDFVFVGRHHRELLVTGDAATLTATLEATAEAGEIVVSPQTAAQLPDECRGAPKGDGFLLAATPFAHNTVGAIPPQLSPDQVRGLLPTMVAEHLAAGGGAGEHRQVAVAFVEFRGIGDLHARRGPGGLVEALEHLVDITQDACHRYGVSFHETDIGPDGGKFMLVAGAPRALDDPCEAMLCVARAVIENPGALTVRIGVTTGRVFTGCVGPPYRRSYSVKGDVVNLAARIMGKTPPGGVRALPAVVEQSRTQFELTDVEPFAVKGKKQLVHAYDIGAPVTRARSDVELPFIGRIAHLARLWVGVVHASESKGSVFEIVGDAGSGKTRMLAELVQLATNFGVLRVGGEPYRSATAYAVIRQLLVQAIGLGSAAPSVLATRLAGWCAAVAPELQPWLPLLGDVLDIPVDETAETSDLDDRFRRARTETVIVDTLTAALSKPTLVVVDDAQFADEASTSALARIAAAAPERPWLFVIARRPGGPIIVDEEALLLETLPDDEARMLVLTATRDAPLAPRIVDAVIERADGNPMFLRALARAASSTTSSAALPDSIELLLVAQIDELPPSDRELMRAASVIGMTIEPDLLCAVLDLTPDALDRGMQRLHNFLGPDGRAIRFRQALIRDAAYESLPYRLRLHLHGRVADELIARFGEDDDVVALLSLHQWHAGRFADTAHTARRAAEHAVAVYANVDAEVLFDRAITAARRLADVPAETLADLHEQLGEVRVRLGNFELADASYAAARRLMAKDVMAVARIGLKSARSATQQGDFQLTLRRLRRAARLLDGQSGLEAVQLLCDIDMHAAKTQFRLGKMRAARTDCQVLLDRIDTPAPDLARTEVIAEALSLLDLAELTLGQPGDQARAERALRLFEGLGDLGAQARILNRIGWRAYMDGRWMDATEIYRRAADLYSRVGDSIDASMAEANIAEILVDQGRLAPAEETLRSALQIARAARARNEAAFAYSLLGRTLARQRDGDGARAMLAEARLRFEEQGARTEIVDADAYLAECLLIEGRLDEALSAARATLRQAQMLAELPVQAPLLHRIIGACLDASGNYDGATAEYDAALSIARQREAGHEIAFTLTAMIERATRTGRAIDPEWPRESADLRARLGLVIDLDH